MYPIDGMRCPAPQAKAALSTERHNFFLPATGTNKLAIALLWVTAAEHLLNHFPRPLILWVLPQKFVEPITKDLFETLQPDPSAHNHPEILP
jgi:hypothetical protein